MRRGDFLLGYMIGRGILVVPEAFTIALVGYLVWGVPFRGSMAAMLAKLKAWQAKTKAPIPAEPNPDFGKTEASGGGKKKGGKRGRFLKETLAHAETSGAELTMPSGTS